MQKADKLLGHFGPNKRAARSAPQPTSVLVIGADTAQGQSVCKHLVSDGMFIVYGLIDHTRGNSTGYELQDLMVKVVQGNINVAGSYEEHLRDKDAVFIHMDFKEFHTPGEDVDRAINAEYEQSKAIIDACLAAGVKHVVYSALDDFPPDKRVAHCSAKAEVVKYIKSTTLPTTYLYTCTPFSDVLHYLSKRGDNDYLLTLPITDDTSMPGYPVEQTGEWVKVAMQKPEKWTGHDMHACTEKITPSAIVETLSKMSKKQFETTHLSKEEFYSEKHQAQVGINWPHFRTYLEGYIDRDVIQSEHAVPHQWRFKQWAVQSAELKKVLETT